jgi:hypothetical protein
MATVKHLSYPGGPPGLAVRLDRHDLKTQFWTSAKRAWAAIPLFAVLVAIFIHLNTRPNLYGLLGTLCIGMAIMAAFFPAIVVGNLWMSTYYFDERWIAWYLGARRRSVDVTMIRKITSKWRNSDGCWGIRSAKSSLVFRLRVPQAILEVDEVRALVASGLAIAVAAHHVELDSRTRKTFGQLPPARSVHDQVSEPSRDPSRPPALPWPGMPRGGFDLHFPRRKA